VNAHEQVRRFSWRHIVNHWVMLVCFAGLVLSGLPQKFPGQTWAKGIVLLIGGVERVRWLHHFLGTIMALQLVWHALEAVWLHWVRRLPMPMLPRLADLVAFRDQVRFNLGVAGEPPRMERYTFAEKLEYLALIWGTALMVLTGLVLLYPVRWSSLISGEAILAAKAAHGGEAILALLSILTWHFYFVHLRHANKSIFNGFLDEESYAEEHALELTQIRRGAAPVPARPRLGRFLAFLALSLLVLLGVAGLMLWLVGASTVGLTG
jgi:cytochrome b subunit of formate dehydrogenase